MTHASGNDSDHCLRARALRTDILASPEVWIPRRDIIVEWLDAFLLRATERSYKLGGTELADLSALDTFLRRRKVPAAA